MATIGIERREATPNLSATSVFARTTAFRAHEKISFCSGKLTRAPRPDDYAFATRGGQRKARLFQRFTLSERNRIGSDRIGSDRIAS